MTTIAVEELEAHLREVLARVRAGGRVLIASDGEPVAELLPCETWTARVEKVFPGIQWATESHQDLSDVVRLSLPEGVDPVAMLIEDREDRDPLR